MIVAVDLQFVDFSKLEVHLHVHVLVSASDYVCISIDTTSLSIVCTSFHVCIYLDDMYSQLCMQMLLQ